MLQDVDCGALAAGFELETSIAEVPGQKQARAH